MSELRDPPRILDSMEEDVPSFLREGLEAERIDPGPDASHIEQLAEKIPAAAGRPVATSTSWLARPGVVAAAGAGLLGLVALVAITTRSESSSRTVISETTTPSVVATAAPIAPPPAETNPEPRTFRPDDLPTAATVAAPAPRAPSSPSARPQETAPAAKAATTEGAEIDLLARAHDALRSRPAETLALCHEHEREFANGRFAQEREALAIEALLYLHRRSEAEQRWSVFQQRYPTSNHRTHLADLFSGAAAPAP